MDETPKQLFQKGSCPFTNDPAARDRLMKVESDIKTLVNSNERSETLNIRMVRFEEQEKYIRNTLEEIGKTMKELTQKLVKFNDMYRKLEDKIDGKVGDIYKRLLGFSIAVIVAMLTGIITMLIKL